MAPRDKTSWPHCHVIVVKLGWEGNVVGSRNQIRTQIPTAPASDVEAFDPIIELEQVKPRDGPR